MPERERTGVEESLQGASYTDPTTTVQIESFDLYGDPIETMLCNANNRVSVALILLKNKTHATRAPLLSIHHAGHLCIIPPTFIGHTCARRWNPQLR